MRISGLEHIVCLAALLTLATTHALAIDLGGDIGIDLDNFRFESSLKDTVRSYSVNRNRSSHFVNLSSSGGLINDHFANYSLSLKLFGTYFSSATDSLSRSDYVKPGLRSLYGQATFLPDKPFPIKIYRGKAQTYTLRYEANNRSDHERLRPSLSIVRRYQSDRTSTGATWQYLPSDKVSLLTELKQELSEVSRIYDFDENLDIWVAMSGSLARPGDSIFTVIFRNELPDSVSIVITHLDSIIANPNFPVIRIDDLPPGSNIMVDSVYIGMNEFQIGSDNFNAYVNNVDVQENLTIVINFRDPATPNDIDQNQRSLTTQLKLGNNGKIKNETFYEYSDQQESVQKQSNYLHNLSNNAGYQFSRRLNAGFFTGYSHNKNFIDTLSKQVNESFTHQSVINYTRRQGLSSSLSHSINHNVSQFSADTLRSTLQTITGRMTYPVPRWNYRIDVRNNVSLLSDNKGYVNNQYGTDITNSLEFAIKGIRLQPQQQFKYAHNRQEKPDKESQEVEAKFSVIGEAVAPIVGNLRFKGQYEYRNRWDELVSDSKSRYIFDLYVDKKFSPAYKVGFLTTQEVEKFWGTVQASGTDIPSRTDQKASYKVDLRAMPHKALSLSASVMIITQGTTSITKYGLSLISVIPKINLPLKSFLIAEVRDLQGIDTQTQLSIETRTSYRIRKISFIFKHVYRRENQIFEKYSVNEIHGKVSRQFDLL